MGAKIQKKRKAILAYRAVFAPRSWQALLALTGFGAARSAHAETIRSDVPDASYTSLSAATPYAASGYIDVLVPGNFSAFASGTLIAPDWVLTAAHVVTQQISTSTVALPAGDITFGQGASTSPFVAAPDSISQVAVEPGWSFSLAQGNDLALIQLTTPITSVAPAQLFPASLSASNSELNQVATVVGYGTTGTGISGNINAAGTRRAMENTIDALGGATTTGGAPNSTQYPFTGLSTNIMLSDFDEPNTPSASLMGDSTPLSLEGSIAPGDSGGGLFLNVNGQNYLAGVNDFVGGFSNNPFGSQPNGYYGDYNGFTRTSVSQSLSFIQSILAIPSAWNLSGSGSWASSGNWSGGEIPEFTAATATFGPSIQSASTITLDANWTVGAITFNNVHSYTIASGNGGTLTLDNGGSAATGAITDSSGIHIISAPLTLNSTALITIANSTDAISITGPISGGGGVTKSGSGTLMLGGINTYAGPTTIQGGAIRLTGAAAQNNTAAILTINSGLLDMNGFSAVVGGLAGAGVVDNLTAGGSVLFTVGGNQTTTFTGIIQNTTGTISLLRSGTGTLVFNGVNTYSGTTTLQSGALAIAGDNALNTARIVFAGGALQFDNYASSLSFTNIPRLDLAAAPGTASTLNGTVADGANATSLTYGGPGTLILSASNTYTGGTALIGGELSISSNANIGGPASAITFNGGILQITGGALTNLNSHNVNWAAFNGGLDIAAAANTFTASQNIGSGAANGGALAKLGAGTLVLGGINTYTGGTTIQAGVLQLAGASALAGAGPVAVAGGVLDLNGFSPTLGGLSGAGIVDNVSAGGIPLLTLSGNSTTTFTGTIQNSSGVLSLVHGGAGTQVLNGVNTYLGGTILQSGTLAIGNDQALGSGPITFSGGILQLDNYTSGLNFSNSPQLKLAAATGLASTLNGLILDGSNATSLTYCGRGTLNLTGINLYSGGTTIQSGALGINRDAALGLGPITFSGGTLLFDNYASNFSFTNAPLLNLGAATGAASTVNGTITDGANFTTLTYSGPGTLILAGTNTYTGGTTLIGGELSISADANIGGATSSINFAGGILQVTGSAITNLNNHSVNWTSFNGGFDIASAGNTFSITQNIGNTAANGGAFSKLGLGTLILSGVNTYTAGTTIQGGTLQLGSSTSLATAASPLAITGGELDLHGFNATVGNLSGSGIVDNRSANTAGLTVTNTSTTTFSGVLQNTVGGALSLTLAGSGTLVLAGPNSYSGITAINNGTLQIGAGGASGTAGNGPIQNSTALVIDRSDSALVLNNYISLAGTVALTGSGTVTFAVSNSYSGGTSITTGAARVGNFSAFGSGMLTVAGGALLDLNGISLFVNSLAGSGTVDDVFAGGIPSLTINGNVNSTFAGSITNTTGAVGLTRSGSGTLLLTGINTYTGPTAIQGGTIQVGNAAAIGGGAMNITGGLLDLHGYNATVTTLSGSGAVDDQSSINSTLSVAGNFNSIFSGVIENTNIGATSLQRSGNGTLTLTGASSYTGGTTIQSGALKLGSGGTSGSVSGAILDNSSLIINRSDSSLNFSNPISGSGAVTLAATGTITFLASNTYGGSTNVNNGALIIPSTAALPSGGAVVNNSALAIRAGTSSAPVLAGNISGAGTLTIGTSSTAAYLRLANGSGTSSQSGLTINAGSTLDISNNALAINFSLPAADPVSTIRGELASGYHAGSWQGTGINSSAAALNPGLYAVGYADGNTDAGTIAQPNQIVIKYTIGGDSNLDGVVNFADLLVVAQNYGKTGEDWAQGDFNYDGIINFPDLLVVAQNYGKVLTTGQLEQLPTSFSSEWELAETEIRLSSTQAVPEPAPVAVLGIVAAALLARRRRLKYSL